MMRLVRRPPADGRQIGVVPRSGWSTLALNIVLSAATGGQAVVTARALGASGRGALVLFLTLASFASLLGALGTNTASRYLLVTGDPHQRVPLPTYIRLSMLLAATTFLVTAPLANLVLPPAGLDMTWASATMVGAYAGGLLLGVQLADGLHALGRHAVASATATAPSVVALAVTIVMAFSGDKATLHYMAVLTLATFAQAALAWSLLRRLAPRTDGASDGSWGRLLRLGVPGLGIGLGQSLTFRIDRYIVGIFLNPAAVGAYSVAATITELMRILPYSISQVVFRDAATDPQYLHGRYQRLRRRIVQYEAAIAVPVALFAPWLLPAVFGDSFGAALEPLWILLVAELAVASFYLDSRCLTGRGDFRGAAAASMLGLIVILVLDLFLIQAFGLVGAASACVVAYLAMAVKSRLVLRRQHGDGSQVNVNPEQTNGGPYH